MAFPSPVHGRVPQLLSARVITVTNGSARRQIYWTCSNRINDRNKRAYRAPEIKVSPTIKVAACWIRPACRVAFKFPSNNGTRL